MGVCGSVMRVVGVFRENEERSIHACSPSNGAWRYLPTKRRGCHKRWHQARHEHSERRRECPYKDMNAMIDENGNISAYKVNTAITFILEEGDQID
jgi:hypothetical protein